MNKKSFAEEIKALVSTINDRGNPDMEQKQDVLVLDSRQVDHV